MKANKDDYCGQCFHGIPGNIYIEPEEPDEREERILYWFELILFGFLGIMAVIGIVLKIAELF